MLLPDSELTGTARVLVPSVREFVEREMPVELIWRMHSDAKMDTGLVKSMFDQGLMGLEIPREHKGGGATPLDSLLVIHELARRCPAVSAMMDAHTTLGTAPIVESGNEEQKERFLPRLATGDLAAFALSEPDFGSDATGLQTTAVRDGDHYIVNGAKVFITGAGEAKVFIVFVRTDSTVAKHQGISVLIIERDTPGFTVGKKMEKLCQSASSNHELKFENARVPVENLLGQEGQGTEIMVRTLAFGRLGVCVQSTGGAGGAFDAGVEHAIQRIQFGRPLADNQAMRHEIVEIQMAIDAANLMAIRGARLHASDDPTFAKVATQAKIMGSRIFQTAALAAMRWQGGSGIEAGGNSSLASKFAADAFPVEIYEGATPVLLDNLAKMLLGRPTS